MIALLAGAVADENTGLELSGTLISTDGVNASVDLELLAVGHEIGAGGGTIETGVVDEAVGKETETGQLVVETGIVAVLSTTTEPAMQ